MSEGKLKVILSGGSVEDEAFGVDAPSVPGIFRPVVVPKHGGQRELAIEVATADFTVRHSLGTITVYADRKSAEAAPSSEDEGGIGFTKEQQWKVDFATSEAIKRPMRTSVSATGVLRGTPDGEAQISAQVAGQVKLAKKFPVLGQNVKKGDLLAYLTPRLGGDTDIASLQAQAIKARVELDLAKRERVRMESLFKDEAVPEKRVLAARAAEESARAGLNAASGRLGQYAGATGGIPLKSPVSGTLVDVRITPGAFVQEGTLLFHIAERRSFWLELRIPESEASRLTSPGGANFHIDGIAEGFEIVVGKNGRLIAIGGVVDATTRTVPVLFEFSQPDSRLRIGMAVKAQVFAGAAKEALAVPASAVIDENGIATVFVMKNGESFERKQVRLGARDGDWVEVLDGLEAGQRVVSRGAYLVKLASTRTGEIGHGHAH